MKTVVITGSARGLGYNMARFFRFLTAGFNKRNFFEENPKLITDKKEDK